MGKHSSLIRKFVNYRQKMSYEIGLCLMFQCIVFQSSTAETKDKLDKALYKQMQKLAQVKKEATKERVNMQRGATTFSIITLNIMTLSIKGLFATLYINDTQYK